MNIGFQGDAIIRDLPRAEIIQRGLPVIWHGEIMQDLVCNSNVGGLITIPKGMLTDGASIPRLLWQVLSDTDPDILYASYAHDFCYLLSGVLPNGKTLTRQQADALIREQMLVIGAPGWKANMVYAVLRAHGGNSWDTNRTPQLVERAKELAKK